MTDRGREASQELTEVRTVLSRAETAIRNLERMREDPHLYVKGDDHRYGGNAGFDPDCNDMLVSLQAVVELLSRWRKTGTARKWV